MYIIGHYIYIYIFIYLFIYLFVYLCLNIHFLFVYLLNRTQFFFFLQNRLAQLKRLGTIGLDRKQIRQKCVMSSGLHNYTGSNPDCELLFVDAIVRNYILRSSAGEE